MEPAKSPKEVHPVIVLSLALFVVLGLRIAGALAAAGGWETTGFVMIGLTAPIGVVIFYLLAFRHAKK